MVYNRSKSAISAYLRRKGVTSVLVPVLEWIVVAEGLLENGRNDRVGTHVHGALSAGVLLVLVCPVFEQSRDDLAEAPIGGQVKRRVTVGVAGVQVEACVKEQSRQSYTSRYASDQTIFAIVWLSFVHFQYSFFLSEKSNSYFIKSNQSLDLARFSFQVRK
jgi:hypothetical protein